MSKTLLIQHTATTTPGLTLPWLQKNIPDFEHIKLHLGDQLPDPSRFSNIILCGGGPHPDQEDQYPWLKPEKKFLEQCFKQESHILGLCLGGQLCATVLGAEVGPHPSGWEIGWHPIEVFSDWHEHKQKSGANISKETLHFSQYHRYIFSAPTDAHIIARNNWWDVQGFSWKNKVIALQFHPERTINSNLEILNEKNLPNEGNTQQAKDIVQLGITHQPKAAIWYEKLLKDFLKVNS